MVFRLVRTDYRLQQEYDALEYRLSHLTGAARLGSSLVIEALHLTKGTLSQGQHAEDTGKSPPATCTDDVIICRSQLRGVNCLTSRAIRV